MGARCDGKNIVVVGGSAGIGRQAGSTYRSRWQQESPRQLPPGQALTADFSVPQAKRTARIDLYEWRFTNRHEVSAQQGRMWGAMRHIVRWAIVFLASWGIGLLVAAWIVPGVSLSVPGFIVGVLAFAVMQAILSLTILKLPREYASLLLGGTGLALTIVALILASITTHGLTIDSMQSWLATMVVVWLVTTIGAITLPELLIRTGAGPF
jgi:hypothetical protein